MDKDDSMFCNCLYYSANALGRVMTRMADEEFAITGLAPSHAFVLIIVNKNQGIRPGLIAEQMQLSPSTVTRLIEKMEHRGLVLRKNVGIITGCRWRHDVECEYSGHDGRHVRRHLAR